MASKTLHRRTRIELHIASRLSSQLHTSLPLLKAMGVIALAQPMLAASQPPLPTPNVANFVSAGRLANNGQPMVNGNAMTVKQLSDKAILNWQNFNIGQGYSVTFDQPGATSQTLNRIGGIDPSVIAGKLNANGQVYLINQNGIVFTGSSQVNVGGLVASTLNIRDSLFLNGVLSGKPNDAVFDANIDAQGNAVTGAFGKVSVEKGALLQANGGRIVLLGSTVVNDGRISAADGQSLLAAGKKVYLAQSTDPAMLGWLVQVDGSALEANSTVTNTGEIIAARGNVTLAGLVVNQAGTVRASTSVSAAGSVYLVAGDVSQSSSAQQAVPFNDNANGFGKLLPDHGGTLTLAAGSVTEVVPELSDTATIKDSQTFNPSRVELLGKTISLQGNAAVVAHGGQVNVRAADNLYQRVNAPSLHVDANDSHIDLDTNSLIDVSGLQNVAVSAERNLVQVDLYGNALQDAPLQRSGFLHGKTITIDLNKGSTLTDVSAQQANLGRTVAEKSTVGGKILLDSEGDVVTAHGSVQNVSGGSIAYQAGKGHTSKLLGADGRVYDVSNAPIDVQYVGFADSYSYTDPKWGITRTWTAPAGYLPGYVQGASAGSIAIRAPAASLSGQLLGHTFVGSYQRTATSLPQGGQLIFGVAPIPNDPNPTPDLRAPSILLSDQPTSVLDNTTVLSPTQLAAGGFSNLTFYSNGSITLDAGNALSLGNNGSLTATAKSIHVDGVIDGTAATVSLQTRGNLLGASAPDVDITLGQGAQILARGNWVNDALNPTETNPKAATLIDGGSVSLKAEGSVVMGAGSLVDVSGGAWLSGQKKFSYGKGGSITLAANDGVDTKTNLTGTLNLGGTLRAAGFSKGGSLSLRASTVNIGGSPTTSTPERPGNLWLSPDFFTQGGFSSYSVTGINDLTVAAGTQLRLAQSNWRFSGSPYQQASATNVVGFTQLDLLPDAQRQATSLTLSSTNDKSNVLPSVGNLLLGEGALIVTDPGGSVTLSAREHLTVLGSIDASAGNINLQLAPGTTVGGSADSEGYVADQVLLVGGHSKLQARGYAQIDTNNAQSEREGQVLNGGQVNITATKGYVVTETGSQVDVSGTSAVLDVHTSLNGKGPAIAQTVAGAAGGISIQAREGIVLQADLQGRAAPVAGAAGGSLTVGLNQYARSAASPTTGGVGQDYPANDRILTLTDKAPAALSQARDTGVAQVSTTTLNNGGFDSIRLLSTDVIALDGNVNVSAQRSITLDAPFLSAAAGSRTQLNSAYVAVGNVNGANQPRTRGETARVPVAGDGQFAITADLIDIRGNSVWSGLAQANLNSRGDIRLSYSETAGGTDYTGSLGTTAQLNFTAEQIYPTTQTHFIVNPGGDYAPGAVVIAGTSTSPSAALPLSAGGQLTINASSIDQNGVLRAPQGQISLNATGTLTLGGGSVTSASASGELIPFGATQNGTDWVYINNPAGDSTVQTSAPVKQVTLNAPRVVHKEGAKIDLSGGGDLYAYEFVAGPGGSKDVLDPASSVYSYAILPSLGSAYAPIDHQYSLGTTANVGQTIHLSGVPGVADGDYALLPARYALLPGAFALKVVKANSDLASGTAIKQPDGSYLIASRFGVAGTSVLDSRSSTVLLTPGSVVRTKSQYLENTADSFFGNKAATLGVAAGSLPADAGQLHIAATQSVALDGDIAFSTASYVTGKDAAGQDIEASGRGGQVSIEAPRIAVVDQTQATDGTLQLTAASLNRLQASTLVLGGELSQSNGSDVLTVSASTVELRNTSDNTLHGPEIILAATQQVTARAGSAIEGAQTGAIVSTVPSRKLQVQGDGALLRVSSGGSADLDRQNVNSATAQGVLSIESGASVVATGSLLIDGAANSLVDSKAKISAPTVSLASSRISLGNAPVGNNGLILSAGLLSQLKGLTDLALRSYGSVDLYGSVNFGADSALHSVTIDTPTLAGHGSQDKRITAQNITVKNVGAASSVGAGVSAEDSGTLTLYAVAGSDVSTGHLTLGGGDKAITGFGAVKLQADGDIRATGTGSLSLNQAGDLTLQATRVITTSGADQRITNNSGVLHFARNVSDGNLSGLSAGLGGKLQLTAQAIDGNGRIELPSGALTLHATGDAGNIDLQTEASLSVAGVSKAMGNTYGTVAGGQITLQADHGNVSVANGAVVDVSGAGAANGDSGGSDAGRLTVSTPEGRFTAAAGSIQGHAISGQHGGDFMLDAKVIDSLPVLNQLLNAGGFVGAVSARARTGDLSLGANDALQASNINLSVDQGNLTVLGTLSTHGAAGGGDINLSAGGDLTLDGAQLLAQAASGSASQGGNVLLNSTGGTITVSAGTNADGMARATRIDLSGDGLDANAYSRDGSLTLRAARVGNTDVKVSQLDASISSAKPVVLEAVKTYVVNASIGKDTATLGGIGTLAQGNLAVSTVTADVGSFINNAASDVANRLSSSGHDVQVRAGVEVRSTGNLTVSSDLDLHGSAWRVNGVPVNLTLLAAGNLLLKGSLSDGFSTATPTGALSAGDSASLRLVAGADLAATGPLSTQLLSAPKIAAGSGNFVLAPGKLVRTGNGSIDVAAAGDIRLGYSYTSAADVDNNAGDYNAGNAQASVIYTAGVPGNTLSTSLFTVPKAGAGKVALVTTPSYASGGGNVSLSAGKNVSSAPTAQLIADWLWRRGKLNADGTIASATATSWWVAYDQFQQGVGTLGGGNVSVSAGSDISNLSVVAPTMGRLTGAANSMPDAAKLLVTGGGNIHVHAGGDIKSGLFEVDRGQAVIQAGGSLTTGHNNIEGSAIYPIVAVGDNSSADLRARGDLTIEGSINATALPISTVGNAKIGTNAKSFFYTFGGYGVDGESTSGLSLSSSGGDISLGVADADQALQASATGLMWSNNYNKSNALVTPAILRVTALAGSVDLGSFTNLFPSALGNATVLAANDVKGGLTMPETNPVKTANPLLPTTNGLASNSYLNTVSLPQIPLHQDDGQSVRIVSDAGSIRDGAYILPKSAELIAGLDISNLNFTGKNLNVNDVTVLQAGRDIIQPVAKDANNQLIANNNGILVGGPGQLQVLAGRHVSLGNSDGIVTDGSVRDVRLTSGGATVYVAAGLGVGANGKLNQPAYAEFVQRYLGGSTAPGLMNFMAGQPGFGGASNAGALAAYLASSRAQQLGLFSGLGGSDALDAFLQLPPSQQLGYFAGLVAVNRFTGLSADQQQSYLRTLNPDGLAQTLQQLTGKNTITPANALQALGGLSTDQIKSLIGPAAHVYAAELSSYMQKLGLATTDTPYADLLSHFSQLSGQQQLPLVTQVLYAELRATGLAHNQHGTDYERGYEALGTLFPGHDAQGNSLSYQGDIQLFFSQIKTTQGGDVNLLAPGGSVVVGLPNPPAKLYALKAKDVPVDKLDDVAFNRSAAAPYLGIMAIGDGAVRGVARHNFTVSQERILTLQGGDILLWASQGDIDAGKGSKTVSSAPPPVIQTDASGNVYVNASASVSGSGIGQLLTKVDQQAGSVDLIAPHGEVNAGEAGIRVAGNLNIAAQVVVGADNIKVGGTSSGVPVADAGALAGTLSGATSAGDSSRNAVDQVAKSVSDAAQASQQLKDAFKPNIVVVKLFCLGAECATN